VRATVTAETSTNALSSAATAAATTKPAPKKKKAQTGGRATNRKNCITPNIFKWMRDDIFKCKDVKAGMGDFEEYYTKFATQLKFKFQEVSESKNSRQGESLGRRSSVGDDLLIDEESIDAATTNIKRLSSLHVGHYYSIHVISMIELYEH
jgi:opacity protein-like surface antigen